MSLFISNAAFGGNPALLGISKLAILVASIVAAVIGAGLLLATSPSAEGATQIRSGDS